MAKNSNFYRINFEKEIVVQGRTTVFLSIEATNTDDATIWGPTDALWVLPYIQPQTFESKFEGWTYIPAVVPAAGTFYFRESDIAKTGPYGISGWDSIEIGDSVKAVTMHRRTLPGETPSGTNGPIDNVHFQSTIADKGQTVTSTGESIYYVTINNPVNAQAPGEEFLLQIGAWKEDNNWYINQTNATDVARGLLASNIGGLLAYSYSGTPIPNQFDGQVSTEDWPAAADWGQRVVFGTYNPAAVWDSTTDVQPRITYRLDFDGEADSHIKINFLIAKTENVEIPAVWNAVLDVFNELSLSTVNYGQKLAQVDQPALYSHFIDYEELHLFGYAETSVRTDRTTYQNEYPKFGGEIFDDLYSYGLLKTNPKLSGNIKLTVDSGGALSLNSIDASEELSDARFKKFAVSSDSTYQRDLYTFLDNGSVPAETIFKLYEVDDQYLNTKRSFSEQYDNFYNYGVEQLNSKFYDESLSFFAPIWLRKEMPDFFVIFRLDHPINPLTYQNANNKDLFNEFFKDARIIKTFDMRESSPLGTYLRKLINDPRTIERPLQVSFDKDTPTTWFGIDYTSAAITGKDEFLYDFWKEDNRILDFENYITGGFERNGLISTNLINLEFLFDDDEATLYTLNRYFGFYVKENQLAEFEIEPTILGAIPGQTPLPKAGVDGAPYNMQPFIQDNSNGIVLPVHYYHNPPSGPLNLGSQPDYEGLTVGKFPLPSMVDDPLRIFYVKDRFDIFKRVNKLEEKNYGSIGAPSFRRVTELTLFDQQENISDFGGLTQLNSQIKSELLNGGNSQLVVYVEDIGQNGKPLANDERLIIEYKKLNTERRDYFYKLEVLSVIGTVVTFDVYVPDYNGLTPTIPTLFATQISVDLSSTSSGYVDSFLRFEITNTTILAGDIWNVEVYDGNIVSAITTSAAAQITFYGEANYQSYRWVMEANPIGLLPGEAWDYPVIDPFGRDNLNTFCNEGTPEQVATAIAQCINKFPNGIVKATAVGNAIYMKSLKDWEDGNNISFKREYRRDASYYNALGYYEVGNVERGPLSYTATNPISLLVNPYTNIYIDRDFYISITPVTTTSWNILVRRDVDPSNPTISGVPTWYFVSSPQTVLSLTEFDIDLTPFASSTYTGTITVTWGDSASEQYFVGGVKRNRARAKVNILDGERFYQDRKTTIAADLTLGSNVLTNVTNLVGVYVGAPVIGSGIPANARVVEIAGSTLILNKVVTETAMSVSLNAGDLSILNDSIIAQTWFQIQKDNYSRLLTWNVQGKYVYSLPDLENGVTNANDYSILQVEKPNEEFYFTFDKKIISYNVYRPKFGILSLLPLKTFDVDTYFSEYSYAPTVELLRYYNREELTGTYLASDLSPDIPGELPLNMGENYDITVDISEWSGLPTESIDLYFEIEAYDSIDKTWKAIDTVVTKVFVDPTAWYSTYFAQPITADMQRGLKTIQINTFYPMYFYDFMEVPNDYDDSSSQGGPYNAANLQVGRTDQTNLGPQYTAVGTRNFVRKRLHATDGNESKITKARIANVKLFSSWTSSGLLSLGFKYSIKAESSNYYKDTNISRFSGFSSLQDFLTQEDMAQIQQYSEEQSFEKFTYQMLLSEYDRLRENQEKDLAVKSKVVPSILKWVQEGTDARDNYYRLNNSTAFGITNFSPDSEVDFTEPLLLTHEFPYLSGVPKDYPTESLEGSRSYFFQKLSDVASDGRTWYDLLTTDNSIDWFSKYFVVGYPTEIDQNGELVPKSRDERYTFFKYVNGLDLSQTLFRGAKINVIDYDTTVTPRVPINESKRFDLYKFAAIARFVSHNNFEEEKPIQIEVIDNVKFKTILMIITIYEQDYRLQAGLGDYSFFYYAIDQLRNSMQTQTSAGYGAYSGYFNPRPTSYIIGQDTPDTKYPMELPYTASGGLDYDLYRTNFPASYYFYNNNPASSWSPYAEDIPKAFSTMRPRQLMLGGGRLELDDTKLGGKGWRVGEANALPNPPEKIIFQPLAPDNDNTLQYPNLYGGLDYYPIYKEVFPTIDNYRASIDYFLPGGPISFTNPALAGYVPPELSTGTEDIPYIATPMTIDGALSEFSVATHRTQAPFLKVTYSLYDSVTRPEDIKLDYIEFPSTLNYNSFTTTATLNSLAIWNNTTPAYMPYPFAPAVYPPYSNAGANTNNSFKPIPLSLYDVKQTFNLRGGSLFYQSRKNLISYASIFKMFNSASEYILHRKIDENGAIIQTVPDFQLQFVKFDTIKKLSKYYYQDDTDKPLEYQDVDFIGYDPVKTAEQEYEFRHRGYYEPKTLEVISFWAREDESMTRHYEKDFILKNTHVNGSSSLAGLVRNYFYNKVADQEVLKIARTSSYKSLYPFIGEIAIDKRNLHALSSTWDSSFYRKYSATTSYVDVPGTQEMKESKVFLASKAMIVPKTFDLQVFTQTEATFELIEPKKSVGVTTLNSPTTAESTSLQTKPILKIVLDLRETLKNALLVGMNDPNNFDEFAWFNSLGISEITYTPAELTALKVEYIEKNLIPLYEIESITLFSNNKEGLPLFVSNLTFDEKVFAGYREDQNVKTTERANLIIEAEKTLDTKSANAFTISAILRRI